MRAGHPCSHSCLHAVDQPLRPHAGCDDWPVGGCEMRPRRSTMGEKTHTTRSGFRPSVAAFDLAQPADRLIVCLLRAENDVRPERINTREGPPVSATQASERFTPLPDDEALAATAV